jgi:hypothetical protein
VKDWLCVCGHRFTQHYIGLPSSPPGPRVYDAWECEVDECPCRRFERAAEERVVER